MDRFSVFIKFPNLRYFFTLKCIGIFEKVPNSSEIFTNYDNISISGLIRLYIYLLFLSLLLLLWTHELKQ